MANTMFPTVFDQEYEGFLETVYKINDSVVEARYGFRGYFVKINGETLLEGYYSIPDSLNFKEYSNFSGAFPLNKENDFHVTKIELNLVQKEVK